MSQIHITKFVFPITGLLQDTFKFMIVFLIVLGFIIFFKSYPSIYWLALIPTLLLQFFLIVGFANLFAGITPFLPDLILVIESSLRGLMFMSGVFFNIEEKTSGMVEHCLKLNPMADILINYRRILLYHQWPEWGYMLYVFGFAVMVNAVGFLIIRRNDRIYPKVCL